MPKPMHVGVLVDASRAYGRGICRGIANYADERDDWLILAHERPELEHFPAWLKKQKLDGLIGYIPNQKLHRAAAALGIPVVDVHGRCRSPQIPVIESDAAAIVRLGFDFFLQSGFHHLAYCGYPSVFFSDQRQEAARMQRLGLEETVHLYAPTRQARVGQDSYQFEKSGAESGLVKWLRALPKPVAILACNDIRGQQVINACREIGIRVPEDAAVLGVDNDEIICRLCRPTLSSIEPDCEQIGYVAAETIAQLLGGRHVPVRRQIPPKGLLQRASTDTIVADHPLVVRAARLIRGQARASASVEQLCEAIGVSRSTLDALFQTHLGRSVAAEISHIRLQRSQNLLKHSRLPLHEIARQSGFSSATYFGRFFKRETGQTPATYRRS
jgi:LacI family transcriptional regulator